MKLLVPILVLSCSLVALCPAQGSFTSFGSSGALGQTIGAQQANEIIPATGVVRPGANARVYVRMLADTARTVTGFDVRMRMLSGGPRVMNTMLLGANASGNPVSGALASGLIGMDSAMRWCRTVFPAYRTTGGTFYFLVFDTPPEGVELEVSNGANHQSVAWFTKPLSSTNAPVRQTDTGLRYRVNAGGSQLRIQSVTPPSLGTVWHLRCTNVPAGAASFLALSIGSQPDFLFPGAPGNFFFGYFIGYLDLVFGAGGSADSFFALPADPALRGLRFTAQWEVDTPGANAAGVTVSDAGDVVIG